jgi:hypothetical protein
MPYDRMPDEDVWTRATGRQAERLPRCHNLAGGKGGGDHTSRAWPDESRDGCEPLLKTKRRQFQPPLLAAS